jgi:hypothetical protein
MFPFLLRQPPKRHDGCIGADVYVSREGGAALVLALLFTGFLLLLGSALLTIASNERQVGLNDRKAVQALYLAEAAVEHARRLLPRVETNDVLVNNFLLGDWVDGVSMASGMYRAAVTNNVTGIGGLPPDGGTAICGSTTCDTDGLVVITGTGTYQGALRVIRAVVELPPLLSLPAPLTVVNTAVDPLFEGESFAVSGLELNVDGSSGSSLPRPSIALVATEAAAAVRSALTTGQQGRVFGAGPAPSIEVVSNAPASDALQRLKRQLARQADRVLVNPGAISEDLRGNDGTGQVTLIKGDPSADSNQGLDTAGDVILEGGGHGSGILIVTGALTLRGSHRFDGVVILVGDGSRLTLEGDATIIGSVLISNRTAKNLGRAAFALKDRGQLHFSQDALRGAARLLSASLRVWQESIQD